MKLAFDTYYYDDKAKTVCIAFENWSDSEPKHVYSEIIPMTEAYEPGAFYKRELPCILSLLEKIDLSAVALIIVDSFVVLDEDSKPGLGAHLYEKLERKIPIVGVAKTNFAQNITLKKAILRGESKNPLFITATGTDLDEVAANIQSMHGTFRMPTLLKLLDGMTKEVSS